METSRFRAIVAIVSAALVGLGVGLATGIFEEDDPAPQEASSPGATEAPVEAGPGAEGSPRNKGGDSEPDLPPTEDDPEGLEPGPSGPAPSSAEETDAADAARAYIEAIDDRDGRELCNSLEPDGLDSLDLPAVRRSCPASLEASIGFRSKNGQPVWSRSEMTQDVSAQVEGDSARVVATVFTEYADVREPTIEDDIIYLSSASGRWLVVKPSATLYRAVGIAEIPLAAFEPPR